MMKITRSIYMLR